MKYIIIILSLMQMCSENKDELNTFKPGTYISPFYYSPNDDFNILVADSITYDLPLVYPKN